MYKWPKNTKFDVYNLPLQAFFSDEYIRDFPEYSDFIPQLKSALLEQVSNNRRDDDISYT